MPRSQVYRPNTVTHSLAHSQLQLHGHRRAAQHDPQGFLGQLLEFQEVSDPNLSASWGSEEETLFPLKESQEGCASYGRRQWAESRCFWQQGH